MTAAALHKLWTIAGICAVHSDAWDMATLSISATGCDSVDKFSYEPNKSKASLTVVSQEGFSLSQSHI